MVNKTVLQLMPIENNQNTFDSFRIHSSSLVDKTYLLLRKCSIPYEKSANLITRAFTHIQASGNCSNTLKNVATRGLCALAGIIGVAVLTIPEIFVGLCRTIITATKPAFMCYASKRAKPLSSSIEKLKFFSYNTGLMPESFSTVNHLANPEDRAEKIARIINKRDDDIICLQEVFDIDSSEILSNNLKDKYPYIIHNIGPRVVGLNSGLFLASKYPITQSQFYRFTNLAIEDLFSNKGVLFVKIQIKENEEIIVANTHLQAENHRANIRREQLQGIQDLVHKKFDQANLFLLGDLNLNEDEIIINAPFFNEFEGTHEINGYTSLDRKDPSWESGDKAPVAQRQKLDWILHRVKENNNNLQKTVNIHVVDITKNYPKEYWRISDHKPIEREYRTQ